MSPNPQEAADLVTFTEELLNGKLQFLCSVYSTDSNKKRNKHLLFAQTSLNVPDTCTNMCDR